MIMELLQAAYVAATNTTVVTTPIAETDTTHSDELFAGYPNALLTFASATCIVFILVGVPGNLITIIALARCKKVRNATAVFIINLSLSDLLFCCFNLPLAASTFWNRAWTHGDLLCRLFPLLRYGLLAVSLFTVLAITINRYVMIGHPRTYPRIYRRKYLAMMVAGTWLGAFGTLIPTWRGRWGRFGLDRSIGSCSILRDQFDTSPKEFLFIMAFVVPCVSIVVCYARIFYIVRKTAMRSHESGPSLSHASLQMHSNSRDDRKELSTNNNKSSVDGTDTQLLSLHSRRDSDNPCRMKISNGNSRSHTDSDYDHSYALSHSASHIELKSSMKCFGIDGNGKNLGLKPLSATDRNLSNVSISKTVEFIDSNGRGLTGERDCTIRIEHDIDSAVEESTSSTDNNHGFHSKSDGNCLQILSVHVEPSSSSGIDLPMDTEHDASPRRLRRSYTTSIRRSRRRRDKNGLSSSSVGSLVLRKPSSMNTSGASILYPGRMTSKDRRLLKMILVIFVSFLICYLPITTTKIVRSIYKIPVFNIMGYLLIYLTTCINPIIYVVMSSEYRQAYWNLLMCRTNRRGKHLANNALNRNSQKR